MNSPRPPIPRLPKHEPAALGSETIQQWKHADPHLLLPKHEVKVLGTNTRQLDSNYKLIINYLNKNKSTKLKSKIQLKKMF